MELSKPDRVDNIYIEYEHQNVGNEDNKIPYKFYSRVWKFQLHFNRGIILLVDSD